MTIQNQLLAIVLLPLLAALVVGLTGSKLPRVWAHRLTIFAVALSCIFSVDVAIDQLTDQALPLNYNLYTWAQFGSFSMHIGFMIDDLTATMMAVVTFVSLMVHIYTVGYMKTDPDYQRFFSYISLFTFAMLTLVMANNFMQLFFGWEAVGLVSYLLIGFWHKKPAAIFANLKAFLVNRVGDFGFLLGIAGVYFVFGTLDYAEVFEQVYNGYTDLLIPISDDIFWSATTFLCIGLFIGAMAKSAQVPLHVWLPDSMEGPTPISALIHAATMVTAGVFMVARMSPLFEQSDIALNFIMIIGGTTALLMGFLGVIQNDIKKVIAYSTLSQLGYMVVALGASAYSVAIFHLVTHAFFKALLFLGAGSVIMAMHHEQDIRKMGNLKKYMPITYVTMLIGSLALIGTPFLSGFYSKEAIIEAEYFSKLAASSYAYVCVLIGVFFTALYSFRMFFMVFHTEERMDESTRSHLKESPAIIWVPLVALTIPTIFIGYFLAPYMLSGEYFDGAIYMAEKHNSIAPIVDHYQEPFTLGLHAVQTIPFWLALAGVITAYIMVVKKPELSTKTRKLLGPVNHVLENNFYFDKIYINYISAGAVGLGHRFWKWIDVGIIDGIMVNGTAGLVANISAKVRHIQTGYLYHYVFVMVLGLLTLLGWLYWTELNH